MNKTISYQSKRNFLKKIGKVGILLAIKESYLLTRNVLGLRVHPFKTLRAMFREKDRSQQVLVLGMPLYLLIIGLITIVAVRSLIRAPEEWGWLAKTASGGVVVLVVITGSYLGFWLVRLWRTGRQWHDR